MWERESEGVRERERVKLIRQERGGGGGQGKPQERAGEIHEKEGMNEMAPRQADSKSVSQ